MSDDFLSEFVKTRRYGDESSRRLVGNRRRTANADEGNTKLLDKAQFGKVLHERPLTLQKGSRVFDLGNIGRHGTVTTLGPQVSEIKYDDGTRAYVSNNYLDLIK